MSKIKINPKYALVQSRIDTGATARKAPPVISGRQLAKTRAEIFKRLKPGRVFEVVEAFRNSQDANESVYDLIQSYSARSRNSEDQDDETRSVVSVVESTADGSIASMGDFLLIDLRSEELFRTSHILFAKHYAGSNIIRDVFPPEMYKFKNKIKGKALVVYHSDEKLSSSHANLLVEKGWEEVWIITGGFEEFKLRYPEGVEETANICA